MKNRAFKATSAGLVLILVWLAASPALALSVAEEEKLGRQFRAAMFHHLDFLTDPVLVSYLDRVGRTLTAHFKNLAYRPSFHLLDDHKLNAFAAPGGVVVITRGFLEKMVSVDELASVYAHELAHVSERHLAAQMKRASKLQWAAVAGLVAAALVGAVAGSSEAGFAAALGTMAATEQTMLAYSREMETDADQVGVAKLTAAGYDRRAALSVLQTLKTATDINHLAAPTYLRTHPALLDRIGFLRALDPVEPKPGTIADRQDWIWFQARLAYVTGRDKWFDDKSGPLAAYGRGLIALGGGHPEKALPDLARAYREAPRRLGVAETYGQALGQAGKPAQAEEILEKSLAGRPDNPAALLHLGQVYLERQNTPEAVRVFKETTKLWPYEPLALRSLAMAYGRSGQLAEAHQNLAWSYVLSGDRVKALRNYDLALKHAGSAQEKAKIKEAIKEAQEYLPPPPRRQD